MFVVLKRPGFQSQKYDVPSHDFNNMIYATYITHVSSEKEAA